MDSGSSSGGDDDHDSRSSRHQSFAAAGFPNLFVTANTNTGLFDPFLQQQQPMSFGGQYQSGHLDPGPDLTRPCKGMGVRSSKKRSRASRRAPTTVLTTDTSNFRAMVQEFTGIPAPPFSASPYTRLRSGHLDPIRPFAANSGPIFNPPGPGSNYLNVHNPILSFQSLLQQPQHHHHQMVSSLEDQIQAGQTTHHQVNAAPTQHQLFTDNNNNNNNNNNSSLAPNSTTFSPDATVRLNPGFVLQANFH